MREQVYYTGAMSTAEKVIHISREDDVSLTFCGWCVLGDVDESPARTSAGELVYYADVEIASGIARCPECLVAYILDSSSSTRLLAPRS
jgi:hypothetical protein